MAAESHIELIAKRRAAIRARVEELRAEQDALIAEEGELDMAERVLQRLSPSKTSRIVRRDQTSVWDLDNDNEDEAATAITTVPGMITAVIQEVFSEDHRGVTGSEIYSTIRKRWKPEIKSDSVRPVIWRMAKADRIKKRGKFYYPAAVKTDAVETNGAEK